MTTDPNLTAEPQAKPGCLQRSVSRPVELVLSLFPGIGLLDHAFELEGFTIVRGPDILWGGEIKRFHVPTGIFSGVIGGPPCQAHSKVGKISDTEAEDLIPEFVRVVREADPKWVVMENVREAAASESIPKEWNYTTLRDWDCGGLTKRVRAFWTWPMMVLAPEPSRRPASPSVMATTWKRGKTGSRYVGEKMFLPGNLSVEEYAWLQGAEEIGRRLQEHRSSKAFAVHCLGNGVPIPMGRCIARSIRTANDKLTDRNAT